MPDRALPAQPVALRDLGGRERPVRARVAPQQLLERAVDRLQEALRQPGGRHDAERVAVERRRRRASIQRCSDASRTFTARRSPRGARPAAAASIPGTTRACSSAVGEVAQRSQQIVHLVRVGRRRAPGQLLELLLHG